MELGVLGLDGITASGNGFGSASLDVESLKQKWVTRSEGFKQEGSGFPGDLCRASKVAKTDSDFSLDSTVSSDAHMLRFSSNSKLETSTLPYLHHMEAAQYKNSEYYSSGGLDASTGVYLLSGVRGPFTPSQWLELEQQALIYKYITANEPIPFHLLIPIRKAFESAGFYGLNYPTLKPTAWGWGPFHLGYSNNTDPEPGRCRRTDGKKWRCSRDAVVNQKYCDKHINRGRHRSRKHVEGQSNGHSVSGATTKPVAASSAAPSVLQGGGSSNSFGINQNEHFHATSSNCNTNASLNRMVVNRGNNGQELQDATRLSFLSQGHQGVNLNCSGSSFSISSEQHMDVASLKTFGSYANTHNSLCTYMSNNSSDRLSNLYPMGPADFMSSTSSPINEKAAVSSSLRLSQDYEMGLGFGSPRQPSWKPISWEASMGGPLAEALQSNCISNSTDESRKSSAMCAISPSGVLQRGSIVSMSNSSAGSSPRADNSKTIESGDSLCTDLLGSAAMARSSFFLPAFV